MKPFLHFLQRFQREDGSALIELAIIVPIVTAMLVGVVNFGLILQQDIAVADSARAGAEFAQLAGHETDTGTMQTVATFVAGPIPNYSVSAVNVCTCTPGGAVVSCTSNCPSYGQPALYAQVTASATLPILFGKGATLPVSSVVRVRISCTAC